MSETNLDGLIAGQQVDFATVQRINSERKKRKTTQAIQEVPKRGRSKGKQAD